MNNKTFYLGMGVSVLLLTSSCVMNPEKLRHAKSHNNDLEIYTTNAGVRGIILSSSKSTTKFCAEPPPDATLNEAEAIGAGISLFSSGSSDESLNTFEGSLGGRSVNVLLTREIFYRACEFSANTQLTDQEKLVLFQTTLSSVIELNKTDLGLGSPTSLSSDRDLDIDSSSLKHDANSRNSAEKPTPNNGAKENLQKIAPMTTGVSNANVIEAIDPTEWLLNY